MLVLNTYPNNKNAYLNLIKFGGECLDICKSLRLKPVIHGSVAYLFYTKDGNIEVNDLDLLVPEAAIRVLASEFEKRGIEHELTPHPSLSVFKNGAKVSFHSAEYFLKSMPELSLPVSIEGRTFSVLNREALTKGYQLSKAETESGKYDLKLKQLLKVKE